MLRKWILYSVNILVVTAVLAGTDGRANDFVGLRLSPPTIPYKPGYGSLQAGGGDHYLGGWLRGCSCRRPGERNPIYYRTNSGLYANSSTSVIGNNTSQPVPAIPPAPTPSNVASK